MPHRLVKPVTKGNPMGLDSVELVMHVEDSFGVTFDADELARARTAGDLLDAVVGKLGASAAGGAAGPCASEGCPSAAAFYRVRRALGEVLGVERRGVRPGTAVQSLMSPLDNSARDRAWRELRDRLHARLGPLEMSPPVRRAVLAVFVPLFIAAVVLAIADAGGSGLAIVFALMAGWHVGAFGVRIATTLAGRVPSDCATVGALAAAVLRDNYAELAAGSRRGDEAEVWRALCGIIGGQVGVAPAQITRRTTFDELGF